LLQDQGGKDSRGKTGLVNTIVDVVVSPLVRLLDLRLQVLRQEVDFLVLLRQQVVELGVEHADDLAGLVADDRVLLGVVEGRDREAPLVVLVDVEVDVAQVREALVDGVRLDVLARLVVFGRGEPPALLQHFPVHRGVRDEVFEALEFSHDQGSVCWWFDWC
jgi:hypothetical protein